MIALGADHGGFALKEAIKKHLDERHEPYRDFGTMTGESCDYPNVVRPVCEAVKSGECESGILVCGTGIGVSMAANKFSGIRAALCENCFSAKLTRQHNDANVICLGERVTGVGLACMMVDLFLDTGFEGGRHLRRIELLAGIEAEQRQK